MTHPLGRNAANFAGMKRERMPFGHAAAAILVAVMLSLLAGHIATKAIGQAAHDAACHQFEG